MVGSDLAQLDLQPGLLLGRVIQRPPGVGQLRLIERLQPAHLPAPHFLLLVDLQVQHVVLRLQAADFVDVVSQPVVKVPQLLLLLQPGDPGRAERSAAAAAGHTRAPLAGRSSGRHCGRVTN